MTDKDNLKLYIHIPFCVRKCNYCDFLSFAADDSVKQKYVDALTEQIEEESILAKKNGYYGSVTSVYIGGGTPSCLSGDAIAAIMQKAYECFEIDEQSENTIEINPGTVTADKLKIYKAAGINRISIGMQSTIDKELKELGRIHDYKTFVSCYETVRQAGFDNVNVDVMTALPGQNEELLLTTLNRVIKLQPEHISAYSLIVEENTPFYEKYGDIEGPVIGEKLERKLYTLTTKVLNEAGYEHYEISNYAKSGYASRHNCGYWDRSCYIGLGLGASSLIRGDIDNRIRNTSDMDIYLSDPMKKEEQSSVDKDEAMDEYVILGLRMMKGVCDRDFYEEFNVHLADVYDKTINKYINDGLLRKIEDNIALTDKGIDYGNYVFSGFLRQ